MSFLVLENVQETPRRKLFSLLGVDYMATPYAWIAPILMAIIGIVVAFIFPNADETMTRILTGLGYGVLFFAGIYLHDIGHIISSRIVDAPMDVVLITATINLTLYNDEHDYPSRVHIGRSLGGPLINLLFGGIALVIYTSSLENHFVLFFGIIGLLFAFTTILPLPSLDGAVILRELRNWKQ